MAIYGADTPEEFAIVECWAAEKGDDRIFDIILDNAVVSVLGAGSRDDRHGFAAADRRAGDLTADLERVYAMFVGMM